MLVYGSLVAFDKKDRTVLIGRRSRMPIYCFSRHEKP